MKKLITLLLLLLIALPALAEETHSLEERVEETESFEAASKILLQEFGMPDLMASPGYVDVSWDNIFPNELITYNFVVWIRDDTVYELSCTTIIEPDVSGNYLSGFDCDIPNYADQWVQLRSYPYSEFEMESKLYR